MTTLATPSPAGASATSSALAGGKPWRVSAQAWIPVASSPHTTGPRAFGLDFTVARPPESSARDRRPELELWLEFEHTQPREGDDPRTTSATSRSGSPTGRRYALNVWTFAHLHGRCRRNREADATASADYLLLPDLLVARLDRPTLARVIRAHAGGGRDTA